MDEDEPGVESDQETLEWGAQEQVTDHVDQKKEAGIRRAKSSPDLGNLEEESQDYGAVCDDGEDGEEEDEEDPREDELFGDISPVSSLGNRQPDDEEGEESSDDDPAIAEKAPRLA